MYLGTRNIVESQLLVVVVVFKWQARSHTIFLNNHLKIHLGTSLAVQWLRLPTQGAQVPSLVRELRSHVFYGVAEK